MNIYKPTWLYIKQHNVTGLKYFGKTSQKDPTKYKGSGKYWKSHLKKHGNNVTTIWCQLFTSKEDIVEYAVQFSKENQIVESKEWANLKEENGIDGGGVPGLLKGRSRPPHVIEAVRNYRLGKVFGPHCQSWNQNISQSLTGRKLSDKHIENLKTASRPTRSLDAKHKTSKTLTGQRWWSDGKSQIKSKLCPGDRWTIGMLKRVNK